MSNHEISRIEIVRHQWGSGKVDYTATIGCWTCYRNGYEVKARRRTATVEEAIAEARAMWAKHETDVEAGKFEDTP